ncbi:ABC transporter permease [Arthrobacter sp. H20]|uniref:ABC transporter permease n=1 Tax=Arthrobacter sp. H20 TaxID=1267981 RepID=UPI00047D1327|nr:ABC transporter permease [Arthrobacter sp. H20]
MPAPDDGRSSGVVPTSVDVRTLIRVGERPPFREYLVALWNYRHFVFFDAKASVQSGNSKDRLGSIWLILNPVLNGLTFYLIFGVLLQVNRGVENFIGYLIIGVFLFQMSTRAISTGARAVPSNLKVIQAFNFPRATLLLSVNVREVLASIPVVITMLVLILLFEPVEDITWLWLLVVPALLLQTVFNLGVGLILARVVSRVNDVANVISFAMRIWMYASCVMFPITLFDPYPAVRTVIELNPLYQVLTIVRESVLYGEVPAWESWSILAVWAFGAVAIGMIYFWFAEETYGRDE